jgi:hypothetical protein
LCASLAGRPEGPGPESILRSVGTFCQSGSARAVEFELAGPFKKKRLADFTTPGPTSRAGSVRGSSRPRRSHCAWAAEARTPDRRLCCARPNQPNANRSSHTPASVLRVHWFSQAQLVPGIQLLFSGILQPVPCIRVIAPRLDLQPSNLSRAKLSHPSGEKRAASSEEPAKPCPNCGGALKWFHSEMDKPLDAIQHVSAYDTVDAVCIPRTIKPPSTTCAPNPSGRNVFARQKAA